MRDASEAEKALTIDDIDDAIRLMEQRLASGQGTAASAMCRLSLAMTKVLREEHERFRATLSDIAEHECDYGDECVPFTERMKRRYTCIPCKAKQALEATP